MKNEVAKRDPNYSTDIKMDVQNEYVYADHPTGMTVYAMRLLRIAIAQCKKGDKMLYEYSFNVPELAEMIGCDKHNLYRIADDVTDQLLRVLLKSGEKIKPGAKGKKRHVFEECDYDDGYITLRLHKDMEELLLNLGRRFKGFTKIPLEPILLMQSKYGIRMYELICQKMMGAYPHASHAVGITISLDEVRAVTGTSKKKTYDIISNLKNKVLKPALADIEKCADLKIICTDIKKSRSITGFSLEIYKRYGWEVIERKKQNGEFLIEEQEKPIDGQQNLFDYGLED